MTEILTVYKLDHHGREVWQYPARLLARDDHSIRLEGFYNRDNTTVGYTVFKRGDRLVETFYSDRWYNVFAVYDRDDGALKGWYCNVTRPATITGDAVSSDDLALDVWVSPAGTVTVLDEEEFAALELSDADHAMALDAMQQLLRLAESDLLPR
jgi:protein associated with RNAse G/E